MILIIDYGMGNLGSIKNMLKYIGVESVITGNPDEIKYAGKIILPGVGAFDTAISKIEKAGLKEILNQKVVNEKTPILGICLGMQLLTDYSEEGKLSGLGWIPAKTVKFNFQYNSIKVPHMGWNYVKKNSENKLINGLLNDSKFYFVHSYYVKVENEENSLLKTQYGDIEFDSAIHKDNIFGVQFHPEKSHKYGMKILENFVKL